MDYSVLIRALTSTKIHTPGSAWVFGWTARPTSAPRSACQGYLERAAERLQRTIDLRGDDAFAIDYAELGKVLARRERNSEAIVAYTQAERIEPRDYRNPHAIGILLARMGDTAGSVEAFARALKIEPRHLASARRLGTGLLELGRHAEAQEVFTHALRIDPGNARAVEGLRRAIAAQDGG